VLQHAAGFFFDTQDQSQAKNGEDHIVLHAPVYAFTTLVASVIMTAVSKHLIA